MVIIPAFKIPQASFSSLKKLKGKAININKPFKIAVMPKKRYIILMFNEFIN